MTQTAKRNFMLEISEINESTNVFAIAYNMMKALKNGEITNTQFKLLSGDLQLECLRQNLPTSNEICSLF
jgi:hypothetical protein